MNIGFSRKQLAFMTKQPKRSRAKRYFIGLFFLVAFLISEYPCGPITEKVHALTKARFGEALSWLGIVGNRLGLQSLEFEIHGASLQVSEIVTHLGRFLPPAIQEWEPTGAVIFDLTFGAATGHESEGTVLSLNIRLRDVAFSDPNATKRGNGIGGEIHATINLPGQPNQRALIQADVDFQNGEIVLDQFHFDLQKDPLYLRLQAAYDPEEDRLSPLSVDFHLPSLGKGTITAAIENLDDPWGQVKVTLGPTPNEQILNFLVKGPLGHLLPTLKEILFTGETVITATISGSRRRYSVQGLFETSAPEFAMPAYQIKAGGVGIEMPFSFRSPGYGEASSRVDLNKQITGRVQADWIQFQSHEWRNVSVPIAFVENAFVVGQMEFPVLGGTAILEGAEIQRPFSSLRRASMNVFFRDIRLEKGYLGPRLPAAVLNWKLSGAVGLSLTMRKRTTQDAPQRLDVRLKNVSFSSPDETRLGEGIEAELLVNLRTPSDKNGLFGFQGDLKFKGGEILLGSFYLNLQQDPLRLRSQGTFDPQNARFATLSLHFQAPTLGEGRLTANLENLDDHRGEMKVSLGPIANKRAFDLFVKEPFGQISPVLKGLSVSGETHINASIRGSLRQYTIDGFVETSGMDLVVASHQLKAKGVKIRFPLALSHPEGERISSDEDTNNRQTGFVKADWIQWRSQEWRDITVSMGLRGNTLFFPHQIKLPIWDGTVIVEGARIREPFRKTREVMLGLRLENLNFSKATELFFPLSLPGSLAADFSEVRVSEEALKTRGALTVHVFGGQIEIDNIHGRVPFSRFREISMDVRLSNIDLEKASASFKFGQMGGLIQGQIRDLTFSFGQPERFELEIRSVKKRGTKQYVNADAVNNLSILSTGTGFSFKRGALQFLKYFRYAKLGIYCKLQNDVFTLRGTIHKNGVEYLIKRGLVGGIDVINQNPENRIRWKQMLRRLKAVGQGTKDVRVSTQK